MLSAEVLDDFASWREPERILELCRIAVAPRPGAEAARSRVGGRGTIPGLEDRFAFLPGPELDIASTDIRDRVAAGEPIDDLAPAAVVRYIEREGLYRDGRGGVSNVRTIGLLGGMSWESVDRVRAHHQHGGPARARWRALREPAAALLRLRRTSNGSRPTATGMGPGRCWRRMLATSRTPEPDSSCSAPTPCTAAPTPSRPPSMCPSCTSPTPRPRPSIEAGVSEVALLGTRYTMEDDFYRARLERHGLQVTVPEEPDRTLVHDVIYDELVQGVVSPESTCRLPRRHRATGRAAAPRGHRRLHRDRAAGGRPTTWTCPTSPRPRCTRRPRPAGRWLDPRSHDGTRPIEAGGRDSGGRRAGHDAERAPAGRYR